MDYKQYYINKNGTEYNFENISGYISGYDKELEDVAYIIAYYKDKTINQLDEVTEQFRQMNFITNKNIKEKRKKLIINWKHKAMVDHL